MDKSSMAKSKGSERGGGDGGGRGKKVDNGVEGASGAGGWQWSSSATRGGLDDGETRLRNRQSRLKRDIQMLEEWRRNENSKIGRSDSRIRLITFQIQKQERRLRHIELKSGLGQGGILGGSSAIQSESLAAGFGSSASSGIPGETNRSSLRSALAALEGPALSTVKATVSTRVEVVGSTADGGPSAVGEAFAVNTLAGTTALQAGTTAFKAVSSDTVGEISCNITPTSNRGPIRTVQCNFSAVRRSDSEVLGGSTFIMQAGTTASQAGTTAKYAVNTNKIDKISLATTPTSNGDRFQTVRCDSGGSTLAGTTAMAGTTAVQRGGTARPGETKTNLLVFANVCSGDEIEPTDSDSAGSDS